jgi:hypothetical protein
MLGSLSTFVEQKLSKVSEGAHATRSSRYTCRLLAASFSRVER